MDVFTSLVKALNDDGVRFVLIGVWGVNHYATSGGTLFTTADRDLFLPPDAENLVAAWQACARQDLALWCGNEPLDMPRDLTVARRVVAHKAVTRASHEPGREGPGESDS
jgi:hypothetical protein